MPKILFCLLFFCFATPMWSQPPTQEELEARKAKIQLEIQEKEKMNIDLQSDFINKFKIKLEKIQTEK